MPQVSGVYQPNPSGAVKFYAWEYMSTVAGITHSWLDGEITGSPGTPAVVCSPSIGTTWGAGDPSAPVITYQVFIPSPGTWYFYMRGRAPNGDDDNTIYARLGTTNWGNAKRVPTNFANWLQQGTVEAVSSGEHSLYVQGAEDGAELYEILLSQESGLTNLQLGAQQYSTRSSGSTTRRRVSKWR